VDVRRFGMAGLVGGHFCRRAGGLGTNCRRLDRCGTLRRDVAMADIFSAATFFISALRERNVTEQTQNRE
jgi:hypothetical protein